MDRNKLTPIEILERVALITKDIDKGAALCGGMAAYALGVAAKTHVKPVFTEDVDIVIDTRLIHKLTKDKNEPNLAQRLTDSGYKPEINCLPIGNESPNEKWVYSDDSHYVEFLTDDPKNKTHKISGITAQGLSYFSLSINNTIKITLASGAGLPVVAPAAFIAHKVLTFPRRKKEAKKYKDLYYVCYVFASCGGHPEVSMAIRNLDMHPKWKETASSNLKKVLADISLYTKKMAQADETGWLSEALASTYLNELHDAFT